MDVAQVWSRHERQGSQDVATPRPTSPHSPLESCPAQPAGIQAGLDHQRELEKEKQRQQGEPPNVVVKATIVGCITQISTPAPSAVGVSKESEREENASLKLPEKSSWEKYSEFIMPALEEEWTPIPSPMPTVNKFPEAVAEAKERPVTALTLEIKRPEELKVDHQRIDLLSTTLDPEGKVIRVAPTDLITFGESA